MNPTPQKNNAACQTNLPRIMNWREVEEAVKINVKALLKTKQIKK